MNVKYTKFDAICKTFMIRCKTDYHIWVIIWFYYFRRYFSCQLDAFKLPILNEQEVVTWKEKIIFMISQLWFVKFINSKGTTNSMKELLFFDLISLTIVNNKMNPFVWCPNDFPNATHIGVVISGKSWSWYWISLGLTYIEYCNDERWIWLTSKHHRNLFFCKYS